MNILERVVIKKQKTLNANSTLDIASPNSTANSHDSLLKADIYQLVSIHDFISEVIKITSDIILKNRQYFLNQF